VPSGHVVSQPIHPVVEEVVMSMQSLAGPTILLESVESTKVVMPIQYSVDPNLLLESVESTKVVTSMQSSIDPTLLLESVESKEIISIQCSQLKPCINSQCNNYLKLAHIYNVAASYILLLQWR
jgi:hypothetical protein